MRPRHRSLIRRSRRPLTAGLVVLMTFGCAASRGTRPAVPEALVPPAIPVAVIGHRGASAHAPENTFAAFDLALAQGADYLETDLRMTLDGVLVAIHDRELERTLRGPPEACRGQVDRRTLAELHRCDAGSWYEEAFPGRARESYRGERIPTLEEILERYGGRANLYLELKDPGRTPGMEEALLRLLDRYGLLKAAGESFGVVVQGFDPSSLRRLHALAPDLPLVRLYRRRTPAALIRRSLPSTGEYAVGVGVGVGRMSPGLVALAAEQCMVVHPFVANERPLLTRLLAQEAQGIFTDDPAMLDQLLPADRPRGGELARRTAEASRACRPPGDARGRISPGW